MPAIDSDDDEDPGTDDLTAFYARRPAGTPIEFDDEAHQIGARLAHARDVAGLTAREVADRLGVKESTITKWESGETTPRGHRLTRIAGMLSVSLSWILVGHGVEPTGEMSDLTRFRADLRSIRVRLDDMVTDLADLDRRMTSMDD